MSDKTTLMPAATPEGSLNRYLQEIRKFPVLEPKDEYSLASDYAENGNVKSAHKLVTSHLRLVAKIAMGYRGYGLPIGEVISEGNVGLMQAVRKFDPERGFRLSTYAMWWIRASIQEYILRSWSLVKIGTTSAQKKLFFNLRRLKSEMRAIDDGQLKPDQVETIANKLNINEDEVRSMEGRMAGGDQSLNALVRSDGEDSAEWQDWLVDETMDQESDLIKDNEHDVRHKILASAMETLNDREQRILTARRLQDKPLTLEQLSAEFDISRERVRQIEQRAFDKLRAAMHAVAQQEGILDDDGYDGSSKGATIDAGPVVNTPTIDG
jgi:RNA polymerase sigma-32 factor